MYAWFAAAASVMMEEKEVSALAAVGKAVRRERFFVVDKLQGKEMEKRMGVRKYVSLFQHPYSYHFTVQGYFQKPPHEQSSRKKIRLLYSKSTWL